MLSRNHESRTLLCSWSYRKNLQLSTIECNVSCVLVTYGLYFTGMCSTHTQFVEFLLWKILLCSHSVMSDCDPMDCNMQGFPALNYLEEFVQAHWVTDVIQPSHPLSPPSPVTGSFPMICLLVSCGQSIGASTSASVLPMNNQGWFPLGMTSLISLLPKGLSRVFSSTTLQKHQFFSAQPSLQANSHICTQQLEKP